MEDAGLTVTAPTTTRERASPTWGSAPICGEDTVYPTSYLDADGHPYDSANKYVMHFERDPSLMFNPDGSLDIYLQAESPGPGKASNWLPTPPGQFNLTLRNYFPKQSAHDGTHKVPPVKKAP